MLRFCPNPSNKGALLIPLLSLWAVLGRPLQGENILLVSVDTLRADRLSCYGYQRNHTPNIDRWAAEGVLFRKAYTEFPLTLPAHSTILTGTYSHVNGIRGNSEAKGAAEVMDPNLATFPRVLQESGYRTAMIGKWHLPHDPRGFDYWNILPGQGLYFDGGLTAKLALPVQPSPKGSR